MARVAANASSRAVSLIGRLAARRDAGVGGHSGRRRRRRRSPATARAAAIPTASDSPTMEPEGSSTMSRRPAC